MRPPIDFTNNNTLADLSGKVMPDQEILVNTVSQAYIVLEKDGLLNVVVKSIITPKEKGGLKRTHTQQYRVVAEPLGPVLHDVAQRPTASYKPAKEAETGLAAASINLVGALNNKPLNYTLDNVPPFIGTDGLIGLFFSLAKAIFAEQKQTPPINTYNLLEPSNFNLDMRAPAQSEGMAIILDITSAVSFTLDTKPSTTKKAVPASRNSLGLVTKRNVTNASNALNTGSTTQDTFLSFQSLPITVVLVLSDEIEASNSPPQGPIFASFADLLKTYPGLRGELIANRLQQINLTIEAVDTTFYTAASIADAKTKSQVLQNLLWVSNENVHYQIYNDNTSYERYYVNPQYLGAVLHHQSLALIEEIQSRSVLYTDISFQPTRGKTWDDTGSAPYAPYTVIQDGEGKCLFKSLHVGKNASSKVNKNAQLMFSAVFDNEPSDSATNRFIPLSVCDNLDDLIDNRDKLLKLEQLFRKDIVLCHKPLLKLVPVFKRGSNFKQAKAVVFRGLVPNSSKQVRLTTVN